MEDSCKLNSIKKYCISVDGSQYSDYAFDLVLNDMYKKGDKIVVLHIANPGKSSEIPYEYKPETIISKYKTKLTTKILPTEFQVIKQDREVGIPHALYQVNSAAISLGCTVLVIGYHGHKMNKQMNETSKGINFITKNIKLPTIVVKENISRINKENESFTWASMIEDANSRSVRAFEFAMNYIDIIKDKVLGVHISTLGDSNANEVKDIFENSCISKNVANYDFRLIEKERNTTIASHLCGFVNYNNNEVIDFIIIGHNPSKTNSPIESLIKDAQTNILFYK